MFRMHSLVRWRAMQYKDDNQSPWNRWLLESMLGACHELLKNTHWYAAVSKALGHPYTAN